MMEKLLRVFFLDTLVAHSGEKLIADVIGNITSELVERALEVFNYKQQEEVKNEEVISSNDAFIHCVDGQCSLQMPSQETQSET